MEGSKGSKNQWQIMPYAQCKTYEQKKWVCKIYNQFFFSNSIFFVEKFIKKTLHPKNKNIFGF
jgi:hypothetical protein